MTIVYPVGKGLYVNMTNRCPCACEFCIRKNGAGVPLRVRTYSPTKQNERQED